MLSNRDSTQSDRVDVCSGRVAIADRLTTNARNSFRVLNPSILYTKCPRLRHDVPWEIMREIDFPNHVI